jgi:ribonucleotide monophosphatase NagD (HAD superfamily)
VEDNVDPGSGSIRAALEAAKEVKPVVIGKPEQHMFHIAMEKLGPTRESTVTLEDRLDTDIEGPPRAGLKSILILTGVTSRSTLRQPSIKPDPAVDNLHELRLAWARVLDS